MSGTSDDLTAKLRTILNTPWAARDGQVVPKTDDVSQTDGAVRLTATYLYADMADSTLLAKRYKPEFAAKVMRMYVRGAVDMIRLHDGHIRSFDGDRVTGIFIGNRQRNQAVKAALNLAWVVDQPINGLLERRLEGSGSSWTVSHAIGIDHGEAFIVRGGARNNSDLISVGEAPNIAARLSGIRGEASPIIITSRVWEVLDDGQKETADGRSMWDPPKTRVVGPHMLRTYRSGWWRRP
jgi:adenylate cyclase